MRNNSRFFSFGFPFGEDFFADIQSQASEAWADFDRVFSAFGNIQPFPPYNIYALKDGAAKIEVALAGYGLENVSLRADDGKLIIEGKKEPEADSDECRCTYRGIKASSFKTSIPVATKFNLSQAKATMKDGMLSVVVPLAEERKPRDIHIE